MTECAFCAIARESTAGKASEGVVYEDDASLALLDHRPLFPGHTLLVPKQHIETLTDLPAEMTGPFFETSKLLSRAVERAMDAEGTFIAINNKVSQSVPHLHVHIVPRRRKDGLKGFFWPRKPYASAEELSATAAKIREAISASR